MVGERRKLELNNKHLTIILGGLAVVIVILIVVIIVRGVIDWQNTNYVQPPSFGLTYSELTSVYEENQTKDAIIKYCDNTIQELENIEEQFDAKLACAAFLVEKEFPDEAIAYLDQIEPNGEKEGKIDVASIDYYYSEAYKLLGDADKAKEYIDKYNSTNKEIMETM